MFRSGAFGRYQIVKTLDGFILRWNYQEVVGHSDGQTGSEGTFPGRAYLVPSPLLLFPVFHDIGSFAPLRSFQRCVLPHHGVEMMEASGRAPKLLTRDNRTFVYLS